MKATVYQRESDKKWVAAVSNGNKSDGTRDRIVRYGNTKKEALAKINKVLYEIQIGTYLKTNRDSFVSFLDEYHEICSPAWEETTAALNMGYIKNHIEPYFKKMKLTSIKTIDLDKFYNFKLIDKREYVVQTKKGPVKKFREPLSINTVHKLNKFISASLNYAVANNLILKNPTIGIRLAEKVSYEPEIYDTEKFKSLMAFIQGTDEEIPIVLAAGCGFRRGEICGLIWKNIDFKNKTVTIEKTIVRYNKNITKNPKTNKSKRTLAAPDYMIQILNDYYYKKDCPGLNENIVTRWKPQSLSERFANLLKSFGLDHIRLHDLRHFNAVLMMNAGIPDKVAAERLGHSNVATLRNVYQHVLEKVDRTTADKLNVVFDEADKECKEKKKAQYKIV